MAVWPPGRRAAELFRLDRPARPGVRWADESQWHVTLQFLGQVDDVEAVKAGLNRIPALRSDDIEAVAGPRLERLGSAVLCLPVSGRDGLANEVNAATGAIGVAVDNRPYRGHLTVARGRRGVHLRPLAGARLSATWPVATLTLVASTGAVVVTGTANFGAAWFWCSKWGKTTKMYVRSRDGL